ncbi:hypothetical protein POM88_037928 [Heracleum sosnowskyi]|uniref:Uncharacterized protein n=1 Tax=Heracleum sosnowskyi TaxID=360622 RepID=A0AAD8MFU4_9APIA|nr:hypothetical protein POM88_037928 [Heracleum sosnowskyi]
MDGMAREHVESEWDGNDVVKVHPLAKKYTFDLAFRLFINVVDVEHVTRLFKHFTLVTTGLFSVPINMPGTTFSKGVKGGVMDENGNFMSDKEISNNIIGLLVASYETTSTDVTSMLKYLAELPHVYDEVYKGI